MVSASEVAALPGCSQVDLSCLQRAEPITKAWDAGSILCSSELTGRDKAVKEPAWQWDRLRAIVIERSQLLLPQKLQREVFSSLHDSNGHQGKDRSVELVMRHC